MGRMLSVASRFIGHAAGAEASGVDSTRCSASGSASKAVIHGAEPTTIDIRQHVDDTKSQFRQDESRTNQDKHRVVRDLPVIPRGCASILSFELNVDSLSPPPNRRARHPGR
jgi:hypothetical protein